MHLVDDLGLILPRRITGCCNKHQRQIKKVLARSISMGVLDWSTGVIRYVNPFEPAFEGEIKMPTQIKKGSKFSK